MSLVWSNGTISYSSGAIEETDIGVYMDTMPIPSGTEEIHVQFDSPIGKRWYWTKITDGIYEYTQGADVTLSRFTFSLFVYGEPIDENENYLERIQLKIDNSGNIDSYVSMTTTESRFKARYMRVCCQNNYLEKTTSTLPSENIGTVNVVDSMPTFEYIRNVWHNDDSGTIITDKLPAISRLIGSFANATNLRKVSIPITVRKIGRYAFTNTQLESVTIARNCEYYDTSFPVGCTVNYYSQDSPTPPFVKIPQITSFTYVGASNSSISIQNNGHINYKGGSGFEHLYAKITLPEVAPLKFTVSFCSPTGFNIGGYGSNEEYIYILNVAPSATNAIQSAYGNDILGKSAALNTEASNTPIEYEIECVPTSNEIYITFDFGYIRDSEDLEFIITDMNIIKNET